MTDPTRNTSEAKLYTPSASRLATLFFSDLADLGQFEPSSPGNLPPQYRKLLAHNEHMTVALESFHKSPVSVEALAEWRDRLTPLAAKCRDGALFQVCDPIDTPSISVNQAKQITCHGVFAADRVLVPVSADFLAVKGALAARLAVILDMHEFGAMGEDPAGRKEAWLAFWRQIALHYKDAPGGVIFEILNEPNGAMNDAWNDVLAENLAIIRASNPTRRVVIGPRMWNSMGELDKLKTARVDPDLRFRGLVGISPPRRHRAAPSPGPPLIRSVDLVAHRLRERRRRDAVDAARHLHYSPPGQPPGCRPPPDQRPRQPRSPDP